MPGLLLWRSVPLLWQAKTREERPHHPTATDILGKNVYLASRRCFMGEAVPKPCILKHHASANLYDAFASGLVAKARLSQPQRDVVCGSIRTPAGYACLRGNGLLQGGSNARQGAEPDGNPQAAPNGSNAARAWS
ncbi:MAG: hypothetical protein ACLGQW_00220 [Acidobacteriota bacterium]